jgi:hypothetical protein
MYIKGNKFYADWRDADGRRHRKAFPTELGARRHEAKQVNNRPPSGESLPTNSPRSQANRAQEETETRGGSRRARSRKSVEPSDSPTSTSVTSSLSKRDGATSRRQVVASLTTLSGASLRRSQTPAHPTSAARFPSPLPRKQGKSSQRRPN